MPLVAPLADLVGVSRQIAVLAFQLGDGLTNCIVPTSASLIGCLGVVRVDWMVWAKFAWKLQLWLFVLGALFIGVTLFLPNGVVGLVKKIKDKTSKKGAAQ